MEKLKFETSDGIEMNVKTIAELFPAAVSEGKVNFGVLRVLLGDDVSGDEAYEFTWVGKKAAIAEAGRPIRKTLRPKAEGGGSRNWDTTENLYIEGDNLDVLKLLQESYLGKVKMIYIDPPYNTGHDFIYNDDFSKSKEDWDAELGAISDEGNRMFHNTESNGRFHSDWCSMMYPRLVLARNLLRNDGVIFISIDDNEVENLKKICNEVFGESSFIAQLIWKKKYTGGKHTSTFASYHEYILVFAKDHLQIGEISMARPNDEKEKFTLEDEYVSTRGRFYIRPLKSNLDPRPTLVYPIELPDGTAVTTQWICAKDTYEELKTNGRIWLKQKKDGTYQVYKKFYELDGDGEIKIPSFLEVSNNNEAKEELKALFNIFQTRDLPFSTPKPIKLLRLLVENFSSNGDIVIDFFSGSASTAHAVMQLNAEEDTNRKFIMVQLPEVCSKETEAAKAGYANICEIGKERIRRAGDNIKKEAGLYANDLDVGFRVFYVDDTNMKDIYYTPSKYSQSMLSDLESNIKEDRTDMDLLFACVLDWGLPLSLPHTNESINGSTIHTYGSNNDLVACFSDKIGDNVIRAMADKKPLRAVFRDSSFSGSPEKINVEEMFKLLSPETKVKVI